MNHNLNAIPRKTLGKNVKSFKDICVLYYVK